MNNTIFPNKFKAALAAQQIQIGCWSALASPISTEVLGLAGFDWLVLDGEHAPNDISTFTPAIDGVERQRQRASRARTDQRAGNYQAPAGYRVL
jgi:5-dehydro-4-deoxy-D-glucarate aldolase (EC 4.1.2.20)